MKYVIAMWLLAAAPAPALAKEYYSGKGKMYDPNKVKAGFAIKYNAFGGELLQLEVWEPSLDGHGQHMIVYYTTAWTSNATLRKRVSAAEAQISKAIEQNKMIEVDADGAVTITKVPAKPMKALFAPPKPADPITEFLGKWEYEKQPSVTLTIEPKKISIADSRGEIPAVDMELSVGEVEDGFLTISGRQRVDGKVADSEFYDIRLINGKLEFRNSDGESAILRRPSDTSAR